MADWQVLSASGDVRNVHSNFHEDEMNPRFLADESANAIKEISYANGPKKFAVAFWGKRAAENLGITQKNGADYYILCDLFSGACNPSEIRKLLKLGCHVRTIDGLHSKIYANEVSVLIGSSNASSNGLASSGTQSSGNIEANALIRDKAFVRSALAWFDQQWALPSACEVTNELVTEATPIWERNSKVRRQTAKGLLAHVQKQPHTVSKIRARVLFFDSDPTSKEANVTFEREGQPQYSDDELRLIGDAFPFYEDTTGWEIEPGEVLIEFQTNRSRSATFCGIWRVRKDPFLEFSPKRRLVLLDRLSDLGGLRISTRDSRHMQKAINRHLKTQPNLWKGDANGDVLNLPFSDFWRDVMSPYLCSIKN